MSLQNFLAELRDRNVLKVATAYLAGGWLVLEVGSTLFGNFGAPDWVLKVFSAVVVLGFPIACIAAWGLEVTSQGVKVASSLAAAEKPEARHTDLLWVLVLIITLGFVTASLLRGLGGAFEEPYAQQNGEQALIALEAAPATGDPSIAVLPFADMSAAQDQRYLGEGIANELLNALVAVPGLKVAARTSSFSFGDGQSTIAEIGNTLNVRHVLEGSVRRDGERLRITAQLVDAGSGYQIFARSYDRQESDIFDVQNEIAREIVAALMPSLGVSDSSVLVRSSTKDVEAHDLRLRGLHAIDDRSPEANREAIRFLSEAIERDPEYWVAWAELALAWCQLPWLGEEPWPAFTRCIEKNAIAREHLPNHPLALMLQAAINEFMVYEHDAANLDWQRLSGIEEAKWPAAAPLALLYYGPQQRYEEAAAILVEAEHNDPRNPVTKQILVLAYWMGGEIPMAVGKANELLAMGTEALSPATLAVAARALMWVDETERAAEVLALAETPEHARISQVLLAHIELLARTTGKADLRLYIDSLIERRNQGQWVSPYAIGVGFVALEDIEVALDWFVLAVDVRDPWGYVGLTTRFRQHPVINQHPRYKTLLRRMNLGTDSK